MVAEHTLYKEEASETRPLLAKAKKKGENEIIEDAAFFSEWEWANLHVRRGERRPGRPGHKSQV